MELYKIFTKILHFILTLLIILRHTEFNKICDKKKFRSYLLRIEQVIIQSLLLPSDSHVLVSSRVWIPRGCPRLPSKQSIQIWPCKKLQFIYRNNPPKNPLFKYCKLPNHKRHAENRINFQTFIAKNPETKV